MEFLSWLGNELQEIVVGNGGAEGPLNGCVWLMEKAFADFKLQRIMFLKMSKSVKIKTKHVGCEEKVWLMMGKLWINDGGRKNGWNEENLKVNFEEHGIRKEIT